jgi:3-hydroxyacyl-[acyl-carrier-protein] dehydratase
MSDFYEGLLVRDVTHGEEEYAAVAVPAPTFAGFSGHFPGNPILPAVFQIALVARVLSLALGQDLAVRQVSSAKFTGMIRPGDRIAISGRYARRGDEVEAGATLEVSGRSCATLSVILCPVRRPV